MYRLTTNYRNYSTEVLQSNSTSYISQGDFVIEYGTKNGHIGVVLSVDENEQVLTTLEDGYVPSCSLQIANLSDITKDTHDRIKSDMLRHARRTLKKSGRYVSSEMGISSLHEALMSNDSTKSMLYEAFVAGAAHQRNSGINTRDAALRWVRNFLK